MNAYSTADRLPADTALERTARVAALFDAHYDRLLRLARRLTSNRDDARDLVQETFLKLAKARRVPAAEPDAEAWLVRVLVNTARDQWRSAARRRPHDNRVSLSPMPDTGPEARTVASLTVWQALDRLQPRRRAVLVLRELEEMSVSDISVLLGISSITVRWHLSMARRDLTRVLGSMKRDSR
jgi:RNA polymerase sigma-70 factor (ECF subfamily)